MGAQEMQGDQPKGVWEDCCGSASLWALARTQSTASEKFILAGVWKPGPAGPVTAAAIGVTTASRQQVAGELWGALT